MEQNSARKVNELRKGGKIDEAWNLAQQAMQNEMRDFWLESAFFWAGYAMCKRIQDNIKQRTERNPKCEYQPFPQESAQFNLVCRWLRWADIPVWNDDNQYVWLLRISQRNLNHFPDLLVLLVCYSDGLFEEKDMQPYRTEKGESPSLLLKFGRMLADVWQSNPDFREKIKAEELFALLAYVRKYAQDTQHKMWLDKDEAECLLVAGQTLKAQTLARSVVKKKRQDAWAWDLFAHMYAAENPQMAMECWAKSILCAHEKSFAFPALKSAASILAKQGLADKASMCVKEVVEHCQQQGWNIKKEVTELCSQSWYDGNVDTAGLKPFLKTLAANAESYLIGETETVSAIVVGKNAEGTKIFAYVRKERLLQSQRRCFRGKVSRSWVSIWN